MQGGLIIGGLLLVLVSSVISVSDSGGCTTDVVEIIVDAVVLDGVELLVVEEEEVLVLGVLAVDDVELPLVDVEGLDMVHVDELVGDDLVVELV